jgi:hypothetical protein
MLKKKKVESYSREGSGWFSKENKQSPSDSGRDGEAGQTAQRGQRDLDRAGQPAGRRLWQPHAGRVLNLQEKQNSFSKNFPTRHPLIFFLRLGEGCILYHQISTNNFLSHDSALHFILPQAVHNDQGTKDHDMK